MRQATAYARSAKKQPGYVQEVEGTPHTPYNVAISDWFSSPEIDASLSTGDIGQTIRVKAQDNVWVASASVSIEDGLGAVYEQGEATRSESDDLWWTYTTRSQIPSGSALQVTATAKDLPGHSCSLVWQKS